MSIDDYDVNIFVKKIFHVRIKEIDVFEKLYCKTHVVFIVVIILLLFDNRILLHDVENLNYDQHSDSQRKIHVNKWKNWRHIETKFFFRLINMNKRRSVIRTFFDIRVFDRTNIEIRKSFNCIKKNWKIDKRRIVRNSNFRKKSNFFSFYVVVAKFLIDESIKRTQIIN